MKILNEYINPIHLILVGDILFFYQGVLKTFQLHNYKCFITIYRMHFYILLRRD